MDIEDDMLEENDELITYFDLFEIVGQIEFGTLG
jgi:hypothetical protein